MTNKEELEQIVEKAIIETETMEEPMTDTEKALIKIQQEYIDIQKYLVNLSYKIDVKKQEKINLLHSINDKFKDIQTNNNKWKIFYLIGAYIAGFALGAVVMANWVEIEPYKDMIIEFFKTTNQAAKHIG